MRTVAAKAEGLTVVNPRAYNKTVGNIHSGAPPPWLQPGPLPEGSPAATIGPTQADLTRHLENERKRKLPDTRVGARFDHQGPIGATWLPSFGRVWSNQRRTHAQKEFGKNLRGPRACHRDRATLHGDAKLMQSGQGFHNGPQVPAAISFQVPAHPATHPAGSRPAASYIRTDRDLEPCANSRPGFSNSHLVAASLSGKPHNETGPLVQRGYRRDSASRAASFQDSSSPHCSYYNHTGREKNELNSNHDRRSMSFGHAHGKDGVAYDIACGSMELVQNEAGLGKCGFGGHRSAASGAAFTNRHSSASFTNVHPYSMSQTSHSTVSLPSRERNFLSEPAIKSSTTRGVTRIKIASTVMNPNKIS